MASLEVAREWHEGKGDWYARPSRVGALTQQYQVTERQGGSSNARYWFHDEAVTYRGEIIRM